jgi:spheroidene monooxygenase
MQYKQYAREWWTATMVIDSSRGEWNQVAWQPTDLAKQELTDLSGSSNWVATLTRASIRPASALAFWRYAPQAQADLKNASGCILAMGLGEAPLVRQCTFSVWRDTQCMLNYAQQGAHRKAIAAAYKHDFFSESMFVRMRVLQSEGLWQGIDCSSRAPVQTGEVAHA